jgi:hypothetical protein
MSRENAEFWTRARRAQESLVEQFIHHPDVSLIDVGYAPEQGEGTEAIVLRIHVRERWTKAEPGERIAFPAEVEGIPVYVMRGDYQMETHPKSNEE